MSLRKIYRNCFLFFLGLLFCFLLAPKFSTLKQDQTLEAKVKPQNVDIAVAAEAQAASSQLAPRSLQSSREERAGAYYQAGQYNEAIALWLEALSSPSSDKAVIQSNLASAYGQIGKLPQAIQHWRQAAKIYRDRGDDASESRLSEVLTDTAQAYTELGQHSEAIALLSEAIAHSRKNQDNRTETVAQGILGNAYSIAGDVDKAIVCESIGKY